MKPQEKSREIVIRMQFQQPPLMFDQAKYCALIAVDEIEQALTDYGRGDSLQLQNMDSEFRFWEQVKTEIEKL